MEISLYTFAEISKSKAIIYLCIFRNKLKVCLNENTDRQTNYIPLNNVENTHKIKTYTKHYLRRFENMDSRT